MGTLDKEQIPDLIERLKNKKLKVGQVREILWGLSQVDELEDDQVIIDILNSDKKSLRSDAIQVLGRSKSKGAEGALIDILESSKNSDELWWAAIGLQNSGTEDAIPSLMKHLFAKKQDLQVACLGAISTIGKEKYGDLYVEALDDARYRSKWAAICAINQHCDARAIGSVIKRVKSILSRKRSVPEYIESDKSELTEALSYLKRFQEEHTEIDQLFQLVCKKWASLWDHEKDYLTRHKVLKCEQ